ncbi:HNH endonuclease signature motif containing protein [Desulfovibrio sp. SGI.169]|uniref:HNH endonuclease signature motif containing protein n=1 Tax=Desulfovibrio sp. SGI.169 TaxID=3420561 RepID=UPI003D06CDAA
MKKFTLCATLLCCLVLTSISVCARPERSRTQVNAFLRQQGLTRVPPGYEVDHIVPLCAGGKDTPDNMQLLTREQHREKTRDDLRRCRKLRAKSQGAVSAGEVVD